MNRKPLGLLTPKAVDGFMQYKTAEALSPNTLISYASVLKLWLAHIGAVTIDKIATKPTRCDPAIVLFLLDTRLRASEICLLTIGEVEQKTGRVEIKHGIVGGAKGGETIKRRNTSLSILWV